MKKIKICGLFRPEDIIAVNTNRPDFTGFIIDFPKSHRNLSPDQVKDLKKNLSSDIKAVGVFVDKSCEYIGQLVHDGIIDIPQLHGKEDNLFIRQLRENLPNDTVIWQAIQIKSEDDIARANQSEADFIILDAGQGSGVSFDWSCLDRVNRDFGLAGGINLENLSDALKTKAVLLDISGGVETDKKKDATKIAQIIKEIRSR